MLKTNVQYNITQHYTDACNSTTYNFIDIRPPTDSYQILPDDISKGNDWSNQLIFFAFSQPTKGSSLIRYYIDSKDKPSYRHRVTRDLDTRVIGGSSGWKEEYQFWAYTEEKPHSQAYTVLHTKFPFRSQIARGNNVEIKGWKVQSVFWAYSVPGKY